MSADGTVDGAGCFTGFTDLVVNILHGLGRPMGALSASLLHDSGRPMGGSFFLVGDNPVYNPVDKSGTISVATPVVKPGAKPGAKPGMKPGAKPGAIPVRVCSVGSLLFMLTVWCLVGK